MWFRAQVRKTFLVEGGFVCYNFWKERGEGGIVFGFKFRFTRPSP